MKNLLITYGKACLKAAVALFLLCSVLPRQASAQWPWGGPHIVYPNADTTVKHLMGNTIYTANAQANCVPGGYDVYTTLSDIGIGLNTNKIIELAICTSLVQFHQQNWTVNGWLGGSPFFLGYGGDPDLQNLLSTFDGGAPFENTEACVLEFDMVPVADTVQFRYVFASTTSYTAPCSNLNNHIMGIFIQGNEYPEPTNFATVPGTNLPVSSLTIADTPAYDTFSCESYCAGCPYNAYFVDNYLGPAWIASPGYTVPLYAKAAVTPCDTYHIKIAVAGQNVYGETPINYAAALILEADTNDTVGTTLAVAAQGTPGMGNAPALTCRTCDPAAFVIHRQGSSNGSLIVNYALSGSAVSGFDYEPLPPFVTLPAGTDSVLLPVQALLADDPVENDTLILTITNDVPACLSGGSISDTIIILSHNGGNAVSGIIRDMESIRFHPNPFSDRLQMQVPGHLQTHTWKVALYDITGRLHSSAQGNVKDINGQMTAWNSLPAGLWILSVSDPESGATERRKILKE